MTHPQQTVKSHYPIHCPEYRQQQLHTRTTAKCSQKRLPHCITSAASFLMRALDCNCSLP